MRVGLCSSLITLMLVSGGVAGPVSAAIRESTDIPAESLDQALRTLAKDRQFQILYRAGVVRGIKTSGAVGEFTPEEALKQLLTGTGLSYKYLDANTVTIVPEAHSQAATTGDLQPSNPTHPVASDSGQEEAGKTSSRDFRLAQAPSGQNQEPDSVSKEKPSVEEVIVTGSRIPVTAAEGAQPVNIYTRQQIEESGQTSVADFLNTLPEVSLSINDTQDSFIIFGASTVQLHGLPIGTTLVLLDGRRVEQTGLTQGFGDSFDLGNVPLAAVERIEVVPSGSSAIYGSDAIAGVVNVILKKNIEGAQVNSKYSFASGLSQWDNDLAGGKRWSKGGFSIVGSIDSLTGLPNADRAITAANGNFAGFGGLNHPEYSCNPGNVYSVNGLPLPGLGSATYAAVPAGFTGTPTIQEFQATAGTQNQCNTFLHSRIINPSHQLGILAQGDYDLTDAVTLFSETLYSRKRLDFQEGQPNLFGEPAFQSFTVSPSNPFNPFGETVGVAYAFNGTPQAEEAVGTDFFRSVLGAHGNLFNSWSWEFAGWTSQDEETVDLDNQTFFGNGVQDALNSSDPATALNVFTAGPPGSPQLIHSIFPHGAQVDHGRVNGLDGFVRGPLLELPSGPAQIVVGGQYFRQSLSGHNTGDALQFPGYVPFSAHRAAYAGFTEIHVPIIGPRANVEQGDTLAVTVAGRYDHYSDFGSARTPQYSAEWRPLRGLLIRGTYAKSFQAPTLFSLYSKQSELQEVIADPLRGNQPEEVTAASGGNPKLRPETGSSHTAGFVYSPDSIPLEISASQWSIRESHSIQTLDFATILSFENLFPGAVTRASSCAGGPPCPIIQINGTFTNFGSIDVSGIDYKIHYKAPTRVGVFTSSVNITETYRYEQALVPGSVPVNSVSRAQTDFIWAPRWKGALGLGWNRGPLVVQLGGRYVGPYLDYHLAGVSEHELGNFWLFDASVRYSFENAFFDDRLRQRAYIELGGVNLFNRLPQFSNFGFGFVGYDPLQADLRGRFLHIAVGAQW